MNQQNVERAEILRRLTLFITYSRSAGDWAYDEQYAEEILKVVLDGEWVDDPDRSAPDA